MLSAFARCLLACVLVLTFALQQTGTARADGECCPDEQDAEGTAVGSTESDEGGGCAPACADCLGCAGPARILLSAWVVPAAPEPIATMLERPSLAVAAGRDALGRLERPPRA